jgi:hypothetical protein
VTVMLLGINGDHLRLRFAAPPDVRVHRQVQLHRPFRSDRCDVQALM